MEGFCNYCGQGYMVDVPEEVPEQEAEEYASRVATNRCTCQGALLARKVEKQRTDCIKNIRQIFKHEEEIAELFISQIGNIQDGEFQKITVDIGGRRRARMYLSKDGIKVEVEQTVKQEGLA